MQLGSRQIMNVQFLIANCNFDIFWHNFDFFIFRLQFMANPAPANNRAIWHINPTKQVNLFQHLSCLEIDLMPYQQILMHSHLY